MVSSLLPPLLRPGAYALQKTQRLLDRLFGAGLNPFYYLGAITFFLFWILLITGAYLFLFYNPSPIGAYASVERMTVDQWWYGGVIRSVHRYASDGLVLVVALHVSQVLFSDRFRRHRWLAWFTGLLILPAIWFEGVTGYILVWDRVAQYVARMIALLFDAAPINVEPLSRSLLRNDTVAPALLQILNYLHLALPCLLLLLAWIHCIRVTRPLIRPPWALGIPIIVLLIAGALLQPAVSAGPMELATLVGEAPVDWFYLFPFPIMAASGLSPELLWLMVGIGYFTFVALPWIVRDPKPGRLVDSVPRGPVVIDRAECKGCDLCLQACPFEAVQVEPMEGGARIRIASIEPGRCAECGFCVTACEFSALSIDGWSKETFRRRITDLMERRGDEPKPTALTFVCERSVDLSSFLDKTGERLRLAPTVAAMPMPCIGAIGPGLVEYAFAAGAVAVTAVACPPLDCHYRAARSRLVGGARPEEARYYIERIGDDRVKVFSALPDSEERLAAMLVSFAAEREGDMLKTVSLPAWGLLVLVAGAIIYFSARPVYRFHGVNEAMVIVSFKHNTEKLHACTEEEISAYRDDDKDRRPHMRKRDDSCGGREKAPLSLRLTIDGATAVDNLYEPSGFRNDGSIHVYEPFMTSAGMRTVKVEMIEQREGAPVTHQWEEGLAIAPGQIILLDFNNGFFLHR